jgi:hypothetical protein
LSGHLFKSDAEFRREVNEKLPTSHRLADIRAVVRQDEYRVVIVIVGGPGTALQLPFFSRVTLKNSCKLLDAYGYRVAVSHVSLEARFARLSAIRENARRQRPLKRRLARGKRAPAAAPGAARMQPKP